MLVLVLAAAMVTAQAAAATVKTPDAPAGRALTEFVDSFNSGGNTRQTWLETRTTLQDGRRASILRMDARLLQEYGPMTIVRIVSSSPERRSSRLSVMAGRTRTAL